MNSYYLHNGTESSGPFNITELKAKSILNTTPVWCEGMQDWKTAGEIAELQSIFRVMPPPINTTTALPKQSTEEANTKIIGIDKSLFYMLSGILILVVGTLIFNYFEEGRSAELEQKNSITEKNNLQFQLQEKEIEEQKNRIIEQEKQEFERVLKERKQTLNNRLFEIKEKLAFNFSALDQSKDTLAKAKDFQFLRTDNERNEDISLIENEIEILSTEIENLKIEMDQLYLELEKIKA